MQQRPEGKDSHPPGSSTWTGENCLLTFLLTVMQQVNVLSALLEISNKEVRLPDYDGFTPLHYAAHNGQEGALEMLLQGEEGDHRLRGEKESFTPLHCAVLGGSEQCLALLLAHSSGDVNQPDLHLRTPLHLAASNGKSILAQKMKW